MPDTPQQDVFSWLPALVRMSDHGHDWEVYLGVLYEHFCRDFIHSKPAYAGKRFAMKRHPVYANKEATFWHITSTGKVEVDRVPELRRCERVRWPRPLIEAIASTDVCVWKNVRKSEQRIVIAVRDFSYVVILDERADHVLLWTAYFVEYEHSRNKLRKEYEAYVAQRN